MQQHDHQQRQHYIDSRRPRLIDSRNKARNDDFYAKLQRIRLSAANTSNKQCPQRTAAELLDESKAFFVKSQEVLHNRQTLINTSSSEHRVLPTLTNIAFRTAQPRRSPYLENEDDYERLRLDSFERSLPLTPSTSTTVSTTTTTDLSDCAFESVSLLSLSDQTTIDSANSPSCVRRTVVSSSSAVIERNARVIKWLFQLHKANASPSFPCVQ